MITQQKKRKKKAKWSITKYQMMNLKKKINKGLLY